MVKIVTDSSSDIPYSLISELDIGITSAYILFGRKKYRDIVDITPTEFYEKLKSERFHPQTTQASPKDFYDVFKYYSDQGEDILCITLPRVLSAFIESARQAAELVEGTRVEIYDSKGTSASQGLLVIQAARLAKAGYGIDEIIKQLNVIQPKTVLYSVADTLDYLVRGGRVSAARGALGSLLGINPIIKVYDGEIDSSGTGRGLEAAYDNIMNQLSFDYSPEEPLLAMVMHSVNPSGAATLADRFRANFNDEEIILGKIGPTIGANIGPGSAGIGVTPSLSFMY